jgi:hypothetical protein
MSRSDPRGLTTDSARRHQRRLDRTMTMFEVASRRVEECVGGEIASVTYGASAEIVEYDAGNVREKVASLIVILRCGCRHLVEMRGGEAEDACTHAFSCGWLTIDLKLESELHVNMMHIEAFMLVLQ